MTSAGILRQNKSARTVPRPTRRRRDVRALACSERPRHPTHSPAARAQVALTLSATPKRADHLASTDDPIDECVAVLANGEEPDEEMLAKCQDIAREEFANQATLEDENSY